VPNDAGTFVFFGGGRLTLRLEPLGLAGKAAAETEAAARLAYADRLAGSTSVGLAAASEFAESAFVA
jgi:hypothetical protein